ncbi:hypothetical protein HYW75_04740 [Candidatus Pacearchaeota archaeon]|nr:hypothetical protein [Candidatus Pacearchaeota archaeon]
MASYSFFKLVSKQGTTLSYGIRREYCNGHIISRNLSITPPLKNSSYPNCLDALVGLCLQRRYIIDYIGQIIEFPQFHYHQGDLSVIPLSSQERDYFWERYQKIKKTKTIAEIFISWIKSAKQ